MENLNFTHNGMNYAGFTPEAALARGVPQTVIDEAVNKETEKAAKRQTRTQLTQAVGDTETILGTTTDAAHIGLYGVARILQAIEGATDFADVQTELSDLYPIATDLLTGLVAGTVKLPFLSKGFEAVQEEVKARATATADILTPESGE